MGIAKSVPHTQNYYCFYYIFIPVCNHGSKRNINTKHNTEIEITQQILQAWFLKPSGISYFIFLAFWSKRIPKAITQNNKALLHIPLKQSTHAENVLPSYWGLQVFSLVTDWGGSGRSAASQFRWQPRKNVLTSSWEEITSQTFNAPVIFYRQSQSIGIQEGSLYQIRLSVFI